MNYYVDEFNSTILDRLPGSAGTYYYTTDLVQENDPNDPFDFMNTSGSLSPLTQAGVPSHELHLKIGAVCTIMRNMSLEKGLIKNATPSPSHAYGSASIFPPQAGQWIASNRLYLAYASTFHSCLASGLTLGEAVFDLRTDVFAHSQLYTALSRIRTRHDGRTILQATLYIKSCCD